MFLYHKFYIFYMFFYFLMPFDSDIDSCTLRVCLDSALLCDGSFQDNFSIKVGSRSGGLIYGLKQAADSFGPHWYAKLVIKDSLADKVRGVDLDLLMTKLVHQGFGTIIKPSLARDLNYGLYEELYQRLNLTR